MAICIYLTVSFISGITEAIQDFGTVNADGQSSVPYGVLFDKTANTCTLAKLILDTALN